MTAVIHLILLHLFTLVVVISATNVSVTEIGDSQSSKSRRSRRSISWLHHLQGSVLRVNTAFGVRQFYLGLGTAGDLAHEPCVTSSGQQGTCKPLTHCAHPEFLQSLDTLLLHACARDHGHVGVCCYDLGNGIPHLHQDFHHHFGHARPHDYAHDHDHFHSKPHKHHHHHHQQSHHSTNQGLGVNLQAPNPGFAVTPRPAIPASVLTNTLRPAVPAPLPINTQRPAAAAPAPIIAQRPVKPTAVPSITQQRPAVSRDCGVHAKEEQRIVGGGVANVDEWPWMAALLRSGTDQFCGGVLITDEHVLTASHCVFGKTANDLTVRLGEYDFSQTNLNRKDFKVERITMHEQYDRKTFINDIALLKLIKHVNFDQHIQPICLPSSNLVLDGQGAYVAGWGTTSFSGSQSKILREVLLPVWKQDECKTALSGHPITASQICAGYRQGGKDSCQGDSGGPLMFEKSTDKWDVVGIVSWGIGCASPGKPGVYTKVSSHLNWIKTKILADL